MLIHAMHIVYFIYPAYLFLSNIMIGKLKNYRQVLVLEVLLFDATTLYTKR